MQSVPRNTLESEGSRCDIPARVVSRGQEVLGREILPSPKALTLNLTPNPQTVTQVKQLEDEISQVRKDLGSSEGKREASAKGESSRVRELEVMSPTCERGGVG